MQPRGTLSAHPNPAAAPRRSDVASTTLSWTFTDAAVVEVRVGSADGPCLTRALAAGSTQTGDWVTDGLTFYLQDTLGFSPVQTGLAFLPMMPMIMLTSSLASTRLLPRFGPRALIVGGMLLAMAGMLLFARVSVDSSYVVHVLPGLIVSGLGMGLIFAPAMNTATAGVAGADAGVASAMVNTSQQVGGSIGTALLNTLSASAVSSYLASRQPNPAVIAEASVHGYTTAFWWSAGIFLLGAVVTGIVLRRGVPEVDPAAEPVLAH